MGSDESHFNVSFSVKDKVTRQCPQTTTFFEEKREPKRYRTEVLHRPMTAGDRSLRTAVSVVVHRPEFVDAGPLQTT